MDDFWKPPEAGPRRTPGGLLFVPGCPPCRGVPRRKTSPRLCCKNDGLQNHGLAISESGSRDPDLRSNHPLGPKARMFSMFLFMLSVGAAGPWALLYCGGLSMNTNASEQRKMTTLERPRFAHYTAAFLLDSGFPMDFHRLSCFSPEFAGFILLFLVSFWFPPPRPGRRKPTRIQKKTN